MSPPDGEAPLRIYHPVSAGLIAVGLERTAPGPGGHCFACSKGNGALLAYYFGKGGREVLVRHGANEGISAHLDTRWVAGHREWILEW